ncbi:MAG: DMT family transporter [Flavobacteriales bacterium]|nr:DMT family transporter [Flavobacteriales bacterium]
MALVIIASLFGAALFVIFKACGLRNVPLLPAIVVNYGVAFLLGLAVSRPWQVADLQVLLLPAAMQGALFIALFQLMGISSQRTGIAPTTVASKMSLALTVVLMVLVYRERPAPMAWAGIALAIVGVTLSSWGGSGLRTKGRWLLPVIFIASACSDLLINASQRAYVAPDAEGAFSTVIFGFAAVFGVLHLVLKKEIPQLRLPKAWIGGTLLGCVNYGSIYFLVMALSRSGMAGSTVFPLMNVGVILIGTAASIVLFKEKLRPLQWAGLAFSVLALTFIVIAQP